MNIVPTQIPYLYRDRCACYMSDIGFMIYVTTLLKTLARLRNKPYHICHSCHSHNLCLTYWKILLNKGGLFCFLRDSRQRVRASSFTRFLDHTQRRITVDRTPLDEWSARRRDLYLTTQNTHNRQTSISPVGFERTISAGEQPQTYALDRAATGTCEQGG
jgi:hypothetical protein